nr:hypothetical protein GCM10020092_093360 [Actinoplanes digitatis]
MVTDRLVLASSFPSAGVTTVSTSVIRPGASVPSGRVTRTAAPLRTSRWSEMSSSTVATRPVPVVSSSAVPGCAAAPGAADWAATRTAPGA